jgi:hypothetical protein
MSTLLVRTLYDKLEQEIEYTGTNRALMAAFIPYLYIHNVTGATFRFEIERNASVIFSQEFTSEEINLAVGGVYAHVFYPIVPTNPVQLEAGIYKFRIEVVSGYVAGSSFIGWIQQHQDTQNVMDYIPEDDSQLSFAIRFKQYQKGIKI